MEVHRVFAHAVEIIEWFDNAIKIVETYHVSSENLFLQR